MDAFGLSFDDLTFTSLNITTIQKGVTNTSIEKVAVNSLNMSP
jgi:hypothetical protein